ncbi:hypothetical protein LRR80_00191 [Streptomyces sp. RO-S4]|uniref:hypothetical protein n=1 Tax=unclassified Streptomyces TaxID=2593676 RepID=UPI0027DF94AD|nr:hypothetical protein [Streptomyces sp. CNZ748]MCO4694160.1 hypothetical protein [Streptomyces sp. RO-S4]
MPGPAPTTDRIPGPAPGRSPDPAPDRYPDRTAGPPPGPHPTAPPRDPVGDLLRWAVFSCLLVPVVLLWCGSSLAGAAGVACGLAAVTAACRLLLRRSQRAGARTPSAPSRTRHGRRRAAGARARAYAPRDGGHTPAG